MFSLDQIRGFVAVAEELHFGNAAARLSMTQPPLSRQIKKLETEIGVELFLRDNRSVTLTPAGAVFLPEARRLLALANNAPDHARAVAAGVAGTVRVGFTAVAAYGVLGQMLARIDDSMPGVSVVLRELVTSAQLEALLSGEIDLGLARLPIGTDLLEARLLTREPLVVAVPESHPLATSSRVEVHELDDADVIMFSPTDARYFYDLAVGILGPTRVNYAQYVTQVHTIVALVGAGRGLALVPRSASALRMPGVVFIELVEGGHAQAELHAVWDPQSSNAALHRLVALLAGDGQGATRQHPSN